MIAALSYDLHQRSVTFRVHMLNERNPSNETRGNAHYTQHMLTSKDIAPAMRIWTGVECWENSKFGYFKEKALLIDLLHLSHNAPSLEASIWVLWLLTFTTVYRLKSKSTCMSTSNQDALGNMCKWSIISKSLNFAKFPSNDSKDMENL